MTDWTPRADGGFERILPEPITAEALAGHRLVVDLKGIPVVGDSYTAYLYANEPSSPDAPRMAAAAGFLNRIAVFGHGECGGDAGHCGFRSREPVDPRMPYHAAPQDIAIDLTDAALAYIREKGPIRKLRLVTHDRRARRAGATTAVALAAAPRRLPFAAASVRLLTPEAFVAAVRPETAGAARPQAAPGAASGGAVAEYDLAGLAARVAKLESRLRRLTAARRADAEPAVKRPARKAAPSTKPKRKAAPAAGKAAAARPGKNQPAKTAGTKRAKAATGRTKASAGGGSRRSAGGKAG